jgi:acrylyl-CoA reductase (NADPH)
MAMTFKALLAAKTGDKISTSVVEMNEQDLMLGDVTVAVDYSTVNYKDALAISGRAEIIRQFPLIPGIDLAGTVEASSYPGIAVGDRVVANSWGLSQTHHGGYAQKARVKGEWLVKIPAPLSTKDAMAIGTAGYTAMLSVLALEHGGITPQRGDIVVTGANGGVGSIAIALLAISVIASLHQLDVLKKPIICGASGRSTSSIGGRFRSPELLSHASVGLEQSTPSAVIRW